MNTIILFSQLLIQVNFKCFRKALQLLAFVCIKPSQISYVYYYCIEISLKYLTFSIAHMLLYDLVVARDVSEIFLYFRLLMKFK